MRTLSLALYSTHKVLTGRADLDVDVAAAARGELAKSLAGSLGGRLFEGTFTGKDLVAGVASPLARALPAGLGQKVADAGSTSLGKELPFSACPPMHVRVTGHGHVKPAGGRVHGASPHPMDGDLSNAAGADRTFALDFSISSTSSRNAVTFRGTCFAAGLTT